MAPSQSTNFKLSKDELQKLSTLAIAAKRKAYCPYSNFRVGAALITDKGSYQQGSNVEVASTPVGTCAERCALAPLVASIERPELPRMRGLAVSTDIWPPASPCGMCRQMIREFCELDMPIYMYGRRNDEGQDYPQGISETDELRICGEPVIMTIGELLPMVSAQSPSTSRCTVGADSLPRASGRTIWTSGRLGLQTLDSFMFVVHQGQHRPWESKSNNARQQLAYRLLPLV